MIVRYVKESVTGDLVNITSEDHDLAFNIGQTCPPPPGGGVPFLFHVGTAPAPACASRPVQLVLAGEFPDGCFRLDSATVVDPGAGPTLQLAGPAHLITILVVGRAPSADAWRAAAAAALSRLPG